MRAIFGLFVIAMAVNAVSPPHGSDELGVADHATRVSASGGSDAGALVLRGDAWKVPSRAASERCWGEQAPAWNTGLDDVIPECDTRSRGFLRT